MKLLTVSLIMSCNFRCCYCPVKKWLAPQEGAREKNASAITNEALLKWLGAYIDPGEWIVELTGGEPGLYPEIQSLIPELAARGYRGLVKTNGSLPIPKSEAFQLIAAWHKGKSFPEHYDQIAVIENPNDDWQQKVRYCEENGIPCQTVAFDWRFQGRRFSNAAIRAANKTLATLHVSSSGKITGCAAKPAKGGDIFGMGPPAPFDGLPSNCPRCKNVADVEKFLPPGLRERMERDYALARKGGGTP